MKFITINTPFINWKISEEAPRQLTLSSLKGYCLLNPVSYSNGYKDFNMLQDHYSKLKSDYLITTTGLIIKQTNNEDFDAVVERLFDYIALLFRYLRFESMHLGMKPNNYIQSLSIRDKIKTGKVKFNDIASMGMYAPRFNTMITWKDVVRADEKISKKIKIPVSEEILIDAFDALVERQFDKTILFCAIAIESLFANYYDDLYSKKLQAKKKDNSLRIIQRRQGSCKDPVYLSLVDRTDFKKLLHEIPLYLTKRSILIENEGLFQSIIRLYKTRNKIVHWGAPLDENENERIPLNEKGANEAFEIALDTFKWLRIEKFEILRKRKFILIN